MSENQNAIGAVGATSNATSPSTVTQANAVSTDPTTQGGAASSNKSMSVNEKISSMDELRKKAPQVYKQMLMGIAMNICSEMQRQQERLKQTMREGNGN